MSTTPAAAPGPNRARRPATIQIVLLVILAIGLPLAIDFRHRIEQGQTISAQQIELQADIATLEAEQDRLEAERAYYASDAFIEAWAHDQGKMLRDGERLVIPIPQGEPIIADVNERAGSESPSNWSVWWSLFFDAQPEF